MKSINEDISQCQDNPSENELHFGFNDKETGLTFMKIIFFIKNELYKE
jgi:hypothetical protein